jgi:hypothetical protein
MGSVFRKGKKIIMQVINLQMLLNIITSNTEIEIKSNEGILKFKNAVVALETIETKFDHLLNKEVISVCAANKNSQTIKI